MPIPEDFKYDVRVRERMLRRGELTESELGKHIEALADVTDLVIDVELKQPALQRDSERVERVVSRSAPRAVIAQVPAIRSLENELNDIEEDDELEDEDDEDEGDLKAKPASKGDAAEKPNGVKAEPVPAAKPASDDDAGGTGA
jgi:hypothetical protein